MQVRVIKGADYRYIPRQRFAALPWYQCESVRPLAVEPGKADRLLGYGDACCGYGIIDVIDGLMPGYSTRGLFTHRDVNPLCIDERPTSTGVGDTDAAATATRTTSSVNRSPHEVTGRANSQSPL